MCLECRFIPTNQVPLIKKRISSNRKRRRIKRQKKTKNLPPPNKVTLIVFQSSKAGKIYQRLSKIQSYLVWWQVGFTPAAKQLLMATEKLTRVLQPLQ